MSRPARRAVRRWTWRLFAREWRQQSLIVLLIALALGATIVGATVATNAPAPNNSSLGSAEWGLSFTPTGTGAAQLAALEKRLNRPVDVIVNETLPVPGLTSTFDLRAQGPHGRYGASMLALSSGRYPSGAHEADVSSTLASALGLSIGSNLHAGGETWRVVGIVENPTSLLDTFALVAPGEVPHPTSITVLFDGIPPRSLALNLPDLYLMGNSSAGGQFGPGIIVVAAAALGLALIGLVSIAGFTVIAQRRLRSLGLLRAIGASDANVRQVVRTNGVLVGALGVGLGVLLGAVAWATYRPRLESSSHHAIALSAIPWLPVGAAIVLAFITPVLASRRPGRAVARLSVLDALASRPPSPKNVTRSAVPGIALTVIALFLLATAAAGRHSSSAPELFGGLIALIVGIVLLAPTLVSVLGRLGRRAPLPMRLALRDLGRYRARSASTMAAVSIGVMVAMIVMLGTTERYAATLDYVGPNLAANQLIVYAQNRGPALLQGPASTPASARASAKRIARTLSATSVVELLNAGGASLLRDASGRNFSGPVYVATPALLRAFHVAPTSVNANADVLTVRPGLAGTSKMMLVYGDFFKSNTRPLDHGLTISKTACPPTMCLANPVIQQVSGLPTGTSAPNTVITEHAVKTLGLASGEDTAGWLITAPVAISSSQVSAARLIAASAGLSVETKNQMPTSGEIVFWATLAAFVIALAVLAMSIGLIRAESMGDRRTLAATGARPTTLRWITAVSAAAVALFGALLGSLGAYLAAGAIFTHMSDGGTLLSDLTQIPALNLLAIFVGLPLVAGVGGWLLAGREPKDLSRAPS